MRIGYRILKLYIRTSLFFYFKKIKVEGLRNIPKDKPIILLANHQNALMDALIIVMNVKEAPYFLARSDVFKKPWVSRFLHYLRMIPIYRFRDGRETLKNNPAIFDKCGKLLSQGKTLMLFPEGNHGLHRRVRWPMRKGFVKMIFSALEKNPDLDIRIVPVGLNYLKAQGFPDSVALHIGKDLAVQGFYDPKDLTRTESQLKKEVYDRLKQLTTHIPEGEDYNSVIEALDGQGVDYLDPITVNGKIKEIGAPIQKGTKQKENRVFAKGMKFIFTMVNFPVLLIWYTFVKPLKMDVEFRATLRFALGIVLFPIYYTLLFVLLAYLFGVGLAFLVFLGHLLFNLLYVKLV